MEHGKWNNRVNGVVVTEEYLYFIHNRGGDETDNTLPEVKLFQNKILLVCISGTPAPTRDENFY